MYPMFKNKKVALGKSILKILARAAIYYRNKGLTNVDDYSKEIDKMPKNMVTVERLVICLDDLERKSEKLTLDTLIGFINSLVENGNVKIIVLSNEDKIDDEYYKKFKEKVIGITIPFKQDPEGILKSIVDLRFNSEKVFSSWVFNYKTIILDIFQKQESPNFRSLIYGLEILQWIFSHTVIKKGKEVLSDDWSSQWKSILGFAIATSLEFKNNKFSYDDENFRLLQFMEHGTGIADFSETFLSIDDDTESDKKYSTWFKQTYSSELFKFFAYPSVLSFVTRGKSFDPDSLIEELSKAFPEGTEDPRAQLLNSLSTRNVGKYSDSEFHQAICKLMDYVKNGEMGYTDTLTAFNFIHHYNEILNFNLDEKIEVFKNGMKKASERFHSVDRELLAMGLNIDGASPELKRYLEELSLFAEQLNNEAFTKEIDKYANDLQRFLESDHSKFLEEFNLSCSNKGQTWTLLDKLNKEVFWRNFKNFSNNDIFLFASILSKRYKTFFANNIYGLEKEFLVFLSDKIESLISDYPKTLSWKMYKYTNEQIKKALEKLNQN